MKTKFLLCFFFILFIDFCKAQIDPAKITIARDTFGIQHIFAKTDAEAAYGESKGKGSPHLTDQMELYSKQQTKPITLDKEKVLKSATRTYHPQ